MRKVCLLIVFFFFTLGVYSINNNTYTSTVYPIGAQSIFDTQEQIQARQMAYGLPDTPGEPMPDPEPTPVGELPIALFTILSVCYGIHKK